MAVGDLQEREGSLATSAAFAAPMKSELGTPPLSVHSRPVPAQIIHSSAPLRSISGPPCFPSFFIGNASFVFGLGLHPHHGRRLSRRLFYSPAHDCTAIT